MRNGIFKNKVLVAAMLLVSCTVFSTDAFAWQGRSYGGRQAAGHNEIQRGNHGGSGERRVEVKRDGWFWGGVAVSALAIGAIIASLPRERETVYVQPAPAVTVQPQWVYRETVEIQVPNDRGYYTPVVLSRANGGYVGPQGEFYPCNPTIEQLRALYGR